MYENINKGIDFVTFGGVTNLISTKDEQGNVIKGDYLKFVDYIFKAYTVPEEEHDFVSKILMTGG